MQAERDHVAHQAATVRQCLTAQGWDCGASTTQIIPILLGGEGGALLLADILRQHGLLVPAIRPPTVPRGTSRLRLSLSAVHKADAIERLIAVMADQGLALCRSAGAATGIIMKLVFVHGWGFDARFWDELSARLSSYPQARYDFGFFGAPSSDLDALVAANEPAVLIGHSLGFVYGLQQALPWAGWIAVNGFARFTMSATETGCVAPAVLRDMQRRFKADSAANAGRFLSSNQCACRQGHARSRTAQHRS